MNKVLPCFSSSAPVQAELVVFLEKLWDAEEQTAAPSNAGAAFCRALTEELPLVVGVFFLPGNAADAPLPKS